MTAEPVSPAVVSARPASINLSLQLLPGTPHQPLDFWGSHNSAPPSPFLLQLPTTVSPECSTSFVGALLLLTPPL